MATRIRLRDPQPGEVIVGGVIFTDGVTRVDELGANTRAYFEAIGATIREQRPQKDAATTDPKE